MEMMDINIVLLIMIAGALIAAEVRNLLSCIIAIGLVGLAQALAFLMLKAPDLAKIQLVVEILCIILLLRATIRRGELDREQRAGFFQEMLAAVLCIVFLLAVFPVVRELPRFGTPIMRVAQSYIEQGLARTGAANLVSGIILDFRAYDTLGEAVVLFTAVMGAVAVLRKVGRRPKQGAGLSQ